MLLQSDEKLEEANIIYVQDGKDYLTLGGLEETFSHLLQMNKEEAKKIIFVLIHPGNSLQRWHYYNRCGQSSDNFLRFMTDELIPTIEYELKSSNIKINKRGFLGDSLAGNISLNIALQLNSQCSHLLLQSAAVSKEDIQVLQDIHNLNWNIYQTVGIYEDEFVSSITNKKLYLLTHNRELHNMFVSKGAKIRYLELMTRHEWKVWKEDLMELLTFFMFTP